MACGNNHVSRDHLSSQPARVAQQIARPSHFQALKQQPGGRVEFFVDEAGRAAAKGTPQAGQIDRDRHVHVAYNANPPKNGKPTGLVTVTITDRSNAEDFRRPRTGNQSKGHFEETIFLRPQSPERIEAEVRRAVEVLRSRIRGSR